MQTDMFSKPVTKPPPIHLELRGKIPSFKNQKMILMPSLKELLAAVASGNLDRIKAAVQVLMTKRPFLITKPEFQHRMEAMITDIEYQLKCAFQIGGERTLAESSIRSLIASSMPADDCWEKIPEVVVLGELCEPGQEGASITIERL